MKNKGSPLTIKDGVVIKCDKNATEVVIPEGVRKIGEYAFDRCESLVSVTIPESITKIGECAFFHCTSLTSVVIPQGVTEIDEGAFCGCESLTKVMLPESIAKIGEAAFFNCKSLVEICFGGTSCNSEKRVLKRQYPTGSEMPIIMGAGISDFAFDGGMLYHGFVLTKAAKRGRNGFMLPEEQPFGFSVKTAESALREKIKASDCLISDETCTHRLVGLRYNYKCMTAPEISAICIRHEIALAKQIAFEMGKKLYACHKLSAVLSKNYCCGEQIAPEHYRATAEIYVRLIKAGILFTGTVLVWGWVKKGDDWNSGVPAKVVHCSDGDTTL